MLINIIFSLSCICLYILFNIKKYKVIKLEKELELSNKKTSILTETVEILSKSSYEWMKKAEHLEDQINKEIDKQVEEFLSEIERIWEEQVILLNEVTNLSVIKREDLLRVKSLILNLEESKLQLMDLILKKERDPFIHYQSPEDKVPRKMRLTEFLDNHKNESIKILIGEINSLLILILKDPKDLSKYVFYDDLLLETNKNSFNVFDKNFIIGSMTKN